MIKINIAGLNIDKISKKELLETLKQRIKAGQKTWLTTVYSEFLYAGLKDPKVMALLNKADIAVPDGVGIFWAQKFLSLSYFFENFWLKIFESYLQAAFTSFSFLFPGSDGEQGLLQEKIPGSDLVWDIAEMAAKNNLSVYLLGGFDDTPKIVSEKIGAKYSAFSPILFSNKNPNDESIIHDINNANPDILLVAYGPIKQEEWIYKHRDELPSVKVFMGLGGTFDYIAGKRVQPPSWIRRAGFEWLWRLCTQPHRIKRIWNATFGLISLLLHYKVYSTLPLRKNVVAVILNKNGRVLICQRDPKNHDVDIIINQESLKVNNYWQFPQGGIDGGENLVEAAKREAMEETGLKNLELIKISEHTHIYYWNNALRKFWRNRRHKNIGQIQNIAYLKYGGSDADVKIDNHEFINYKWVSAVDLNEIVHPERVRLTKIIQTDLKEMAEKGII